MRYAYSGLAAVFCLAALLANLADLPTLIALVCLAAAAVFLILALRTNQTPQPGKDRELDRADLSHEQVEKIQDLLADGQFGTAVKQIQLWFKYVSYDDAEAFIKNFR
jgi:membrane protein implicated in regulation of membrane protease activity